MKQNNSLWTFFASVKLAIFTLSFIAVTSIIGTIIPQGESHSFYVKQYGEGLARFFEVLDISDMYYSWWFIGLLGLLSANLIICSIDRFPGVWRIITADNLAIPPERLRKMSEKRSWNITAKKVSSLNLSKILEKNGWKPEQKSFDNHTLLFSQKGKWSRTGVYIVHASILIILFGAIIGHFLGFKGSVMIPETKSSSKIYSYENSRPIDLGFEIRCDLFTIEYYDNGMPKEYMSRLTVLKDNREILTKNIEVNSPLTYEGITFYQSSYEGYQDFLITITEKHSGEKNPFIVPFQQQKVWKEKQLRFGIVNAKALGQRVVQAKLWIKAGNNPATIQWIRDGNNISIKDGSKEYSISVKQMYATGLQVAKDPGVWLVYIGCILMLAGLYLAFFMSHKRIWLLISMEEKNSSLILLAGSANKNRIDFSNRFGELAQQIENSIS
jgi:cytochrome c biogenesis protein